MPVKHCHCVEASITVAIAHALIPKKVMFGSTRIKIAAGFANSWRQSSMAIAWLAMMTVSSDCIVCYARATTVISCSANRLGVQLSYNQLMSISSSPNAFFLTTRKYASDCQQSVFIFIRFRATCQNLSVKRRCSSTMIWGEIRSF